jgi:hypothetical protein
MKAGYCDHCGRPYRSHTARQLAERYAAVVADLKGIAPAKHLDPAVIAEEAAMFSEVEPVREPEWWSTYNRDHAEG